MNPYLEIANQADGLVRRKQNVMIDGELHFLSSIEQRCLQSFIQNS